MDTSKIKRRLRQRMFDYPEHKQEQATRLIARCKTREFADQVAKRKVAGEAYANVMWM